MARGATPEQTLAAARQDGIPESALRLDQIAVVASNRSVLDWLTERCELVGAGWISARQHPYASVQVVRRGSHGGEGLALLVPRMGASPLSCVIEDLVACCVETIILACATREAGTGQVGRRLVRTLRPTASPAEGLVSG